MKVRLLPLLVVAVLVTVLASGCTERTAIENYSSEIVLVALVRDNCSEVGSDPLLRWGVVDPNHVLWLRGLSFGDRCLIVTDLERTDFILTRVDSGATYMVGSRNGELFVLRRGGEFHPVTSSPTIREHRDDASPKLLWVIGLPAVLSALYLGYTGVHFLFPGRRNEG